MKGLFNPSDNKEVVDRINSLSPEDKNLWRKMYVSQMLAHCQVAPKIAFGEVKLKRGLMGILFGTMVKKQLLQNKPFGKSLPTAPEFIVKGDKHFEEERQKLIFLVERFSKLGLEPIKGNPHPFFGNMSIQEWDVLNWKHLDHHLKQFGY